MKVCMHVLSPAVPDVRVMREAHALVEAGIDVSIVDIEHDASRGPHEMVDGVRVEHVLLPKRMTKHYTPASTVPWLLFKGLRVVRSIWKVFQTPADAYHAHDLTALPACYIAARLHRKRLIFDSHELPLVEPYVARRRIMRAALTVMLRWMLRRCSAVITVCRPIAQEIQRRYGGPLAVDVRNIPMYQPPVTSDRLRQFLGLGPDVAIALYQGVLGPDRSLDILIRAARYLPSRAVIVMMGAGPMEEMLHQLIKTEGVEDKVMIIPPVPYQQLLSWTASADIGLVIFRPDYSPSIRYCLPNKLFEYLMAGVPVLASSLDAVSEIVEGYDVGSIVRSLEPEVVGQEITHMLDDRSTLAHMSRNALVASQRELRWDVESSRLVNLYGAIFANQNASRVQDKVSVH